MGLLDAVGGVVGGAVGSLAGPIGTLAGRVVGSRAGSTLKSSDFTDSTKEEDQYPERLPTLQMRPVMDWNTALSRARATYQPGIDENTKIIVNQLQNNALKRGFYGQLPTEEFERSTRADLAAKGEAAIMQSANQMVGQDEAAAQRELELGMQQQAQIWNQRLAEANMRNSSTEAEKNRQAQIVIAQMQAAEKEKERERQDYEYNNLSAYQKAQLAAKTSGGGGGSSGTVNNNTASAQNEILQLLTSGKSPTQVLSMITDSTPGYTAAGVKTQALRDLVYQNMGYGDEAVYKNAVKEQQAYESYRTYNSQMEQDIRYYMDQTGATYDQAKTAVLRSYRGE